MAMLYRPDNVLRSKRGVTTEEHTGPCRLHCLFVDDWNIPFVELNSKIPLDPGECIFLTDGENNIVSRQDHCIDDFRAPGFAVPLETLEFHADKLSVLEHESLRSMIDENLYTLFFGVLQLPGGRFEITP